MFHFHRTQVRLFFFTGALAFRFRQELVFGFTRLIQPATAGLRRVGARCSVAHWSGSVMMGLVTSTGFFLNQPWVMLE